MDEHQWLVEQFEANRNHLQAVAYRMLGSLAEANDAVQECWLRLSRANADDVQNLGGWLTMVVARICLDMLRSRKSRREESLDSFVPERIAGRTIDPEQETVLADSVGLALLVVLDTLTPPERLAFVLHDIFAMPFEEIAPVLDRTESAVRKLASRARRRVQGTSITKPLDLTEQRKVVNAFLTASREGSFEDLLTLLDPDIVFRNDAAAVAFGGTPETRGAAATARQFVGRAQGARPMLVNGAIAMAVIRSGRLMMVLQPTIVNGKIAALDAIADPVALGQMRLSILADEG